MEERKNETFATTIESQESDAEENHTPAQGFVFRVIFGVFEGRLTSLPQVCLRVELNVDQLLSPQYSWQALRWEVSALSVPLENKG